MFIIESAFAASSSLLTKTGFKNIKKYKGKPLIFHTINVALNSKLINRIIISTDSRKYKKLCEIKYKKKIEIPFLRPKGLQRGFITYEELGKSLGKRNSTQENVEKAVFIIFEKKRKLCS